MNKEVENAMKVIIDDLENWNKDTLYEVIAELENRYACAHGEFPDDFEFR